MKINDIKGESLSGQLEIPILFLTFNKLILTKKVFESLRKSAPKKLYFASDGPRENHLDDVKAIESVRDFVLSSIDWDCEIYTLFQEKNLGCMLACSSAVEWFFSIEEMGIVLEEDTFPNQSFYKYCEKLLNIYKDDERIGMIAGNAPLNFHNAEDSYYFSRYTRFWGWASWRRAWKHYDVDYKNFDNFIKVGGLSSITSSERETKYWQNIAEKGVVNTWDYQWLFKCWEQSMLTIIPSVNLVSNIGFGIDATHTKNTMSPHNNAENFNMIFPLKHPNFIYANKILDNKTIELEFLPGFKRRIMYRISMLKKIINSKNYVK